MRPRNLIATIVTLVCMLGLSGLAGMGVAHADAGDENRFNRLIEKYAIGTNQSAKLRPKAICVCQGGVYDSRPGFVARSSSGVIFCALPFFRDGDYDAVGTCTEGWKFLAK